MTESLPEFGISCDADFHQRSLLPKKTRTVFARASADSTLDRLDMSFARPNQSLEIRNPSMGIRIFDGGSAIHPWERRSMNGCGDSLLEKAAECLGVGDSWMGGAAFAMPLNDSISNFVPCRQERCVPFLRMATDPAVRRIPR